MSISRTHGRSPGQMRPVDIRLGVQKDPYGSVQISYGDTVVLCAASVTEGVPPWMQSSENPHGWITSEYAMLPGSSSQRISRQAKGRSKEIQRLIGRSLRAAFDLSALGPRTITVDCDVLQADGGTRTASITGGFLAVQLAVQKLQDKGIIGTSPVRSPICAVSCALIDGEVLLDPDYSEDSRADVDTNLVLTKDRIVEIQATAENQPFERRILDSMLELAFGVTPYLFQCMYSAVSS